MFQSDPVIASLKRGKTRGITPTRPPGSADPELVWFIWLAAEFPDTPLTAQESARSSGFASTTPAADPGGKVPATRRCNRHVLRIADVLEARLGIFGETPPSPLPPRPPLRPPLPPSPEGVTNEDLERHHPPGDPAVRAEARRGLRVVRRPQMPLVAAPRSAIRRRRRSAWSSSPCRPSSTSSSASLRSTNSTPTRWRPRRSRWTTPSAASGTPSSAWTMGSTPESATRTATLCSTPSTVPDASCAGSPSGVRPDGATRVGPHSRAPGGALPPRLPHAGLCDLRPNPGVGVRRHHRAGHRLAVAAVMEEVCDA